MLVYGVNVLKELEPKKIKNVMTSRLDIIEYCTANKIKFQRLDNQTLNKMTKNNIFCTI